jgi:hypothetical protein
MQFGRTYVAVRASRHTDEPVAEIVPNTQPQNVSCVFNDLQRRVISLWNSRARCFF